MDDVSESNGPEDLAPRAASAVTTATYNEIAHLYDQKWHDRSAIQQHLTRFADMIRAYGLAALPVIDVGCGPGFDAHFFRQLGLHAIGIDLSRSMMTLGRKRYGGDYVLADMRWLPLAAGIGGLWVSASFLHLPRHEAPAVLERFGQLLVRGGLLYLSLKAGHGSEWTARSYGRSQSRYFVYWQPDDVDAHLRGAGFRIVDGWSSPIIEGTTWLIRFARWADDHIPLNTARAIPDQSV